MAFLDFLKNRNAFSEQPLAKTPREQQAGQTIGTRDGHRAQEFATPTEPISAAEQTRADRIMATLEKATRHHNAQTPMEAPANIDAASEKLARAMRFVDTTARPKPQQPLEFKWPRPPASWER
jgi:hypothetical protein